MTGARRTFIVSLGPRELPPKLSGSLVNTSSVVEQPSSHRAGSRPPAHACPAAPRTAPCRGVGNQNQQFRHETKAAFVNVQCMTWMPRVAVSFDCAASKNRIYALTGAGRGVRRPADGLARPLDER
jgi:hypothetical protein